MNIKHKNLASGKWKELTLVEQMGNVGSEVSRTITWKKKGKKEMSQRAFERALELLTLTKQDPDNKLRLKELSRVYELLVDYFMGENIYKSSDELWQKYFMGFAVLARK